MKYKICFLGNGKSVFLQQFCNRFVELGWNVHLITWRNPQKKLFHKKVHIHRIFSPPHSFFLFFSFIEVAFHLWRINADLIHAHYVNTFGIIAGCIRHISSTPVIVSAWGPDSIKNSRGFRRQLISMTFKKVDKIFTTSDYLRVTIINEYDIPGIKVHAIPWGIDLDIVSQKCEEEQKRIRRKLRIGSSDFVVISPRNLEPFYCIENAIHAFYLVKEECSNVKLILLKGFGRKKQYEKSLLKLIKQYSLDYDVVYIPHLLSRIELSQLYSISDVLISVPIDDQFSACVQEGIACGVIPVVRNLGVYKQYLQDGKNAFFVSGDDPPEIARKIIYCIKHPEIKKRFYKVNRSIIEESENWKENSRRMESIYMKLIETNKMEHIKGA
ncbi:MAG: glycosyltransferase family 4 protein [Methanobacteriota archaeon]